MCIEIKKIKEIDKEDYENKGDSKSEKFVQQISFLSLFTFSLLLLFLFILSTLFLGSFGGFSFGSFFVLSFSFSTHCDYDIII